MSQNISASTGSQKEREQSFDEYYKHFVSRHEHLERINIVTEVLKKRYEDYEETKDFVEFLQSVEKVFAQAEDEKWSIERTEEEMIRGKIYLISKMSGVDEEIFMKIYNEFKDVSNSVEKIQDTANDLMNKYAEGTPHFKECRDFIMYVRDSLLVFTRAFNEDKAFDEISEVKEQIIRLRMETMAVNNKPPLTVLQKIYEEFLAELRKGSLHKQK